MMHPCPCTTILACGTFFLVSRPLPTHSPVLPRALRRSFSLLHVPHQNLWDPRCSLVFPAMRRFFLTLAAVISQAIKRSKGRTEGQNRRGAKKTRAVFAQPYSPMFGFYGATPGPLEVEVANLRSSTRAPRITFSKGSRRPSELLNPDPCYSPRNKGSICHAHFVHKNSQYSH